MEHMPEAAEAPAGMAGHWVSECDGPPIFLSGGGTWQGHAWPGWLFISWGLWWACHILLRYRRACHKHQEYRPQSYFQGWRWIRLVEPTLKLFGPFIGIYIELRGDHPKYMNLYCADGSFATRHLHNWHHAASYPGFILSGAVDFVGLLVDLPEGTEQGFLGLAFALEAFIMGLHTKHEPQDARVHQLLAGTMAACAVFVFLEQATRHVLVSACRAGALIMQGLWLWEIAVIQYTGSPAWQNHAIDKSGMMMIPVVYGMLVMATAGGLLAMYVVLVCWERWHQAGYSCLLRSSEAAAKGPTNDGHEGNQGRELFVLDFAEDSAHEHNDSGSSDGGDTPPRDAGKTRDSLPAPERLRQAALAFLSSKDRAVRPPKRKQDPHIV